MKETEYFIKKKDGKLHDFSKSILRSSLNNVIRSNINTGIALAMANSSNHMEKALKKETTVEKDEEVGLNLPEECFFSASYLNKFLPELKQNRTLVTTLITRMCRDSWKFVEANFPNKFKKGETNVVEPFPMIHELMVKQLLKTLKEMDLKWMFDE